jgi:Filamin/ABP280 repeat
MSVVRRKSTNDKSLSSDFSDWLCGGCLFGDVDAGMGAVDVAILDPEGHRDATRPTITQKADGVWLVEYTPVAPGLHSVNVFFAGKAIPASPFGVGIAPGSD